MAVSAAVAPSTAVSTSGDASAGFVRIRSASHVGRARRLVRELTENAGLGSELAERAALVATELSTNLATHASGGELHVRVREAGLELVSLDAGPGLPGAAFRDGFSTAGTGGTGLGAVKRLSDALEVETAEGGTVLVATLAVRRTGVATVVNDASDAGLVSPHPGEASSGDGFYVRREPGRVIGAVVDGLGHGELARGERERALAVMTALGAGRSPADHLRAVHGETTRSGGLAGSVVVIEPRREKIVFAGVGNVAGRVLYPDGESASLITIGGILGRAPLHVKEMERPWRPGTVVVLHSDGITSRWQPKSYRWAARRAPAVLAGVLMRDYRRPRDDASILVLRER